MHALVAEKYTVARSLAKALMGTTCTQDKAAYWGQINGKLAAITWAEGHILGLAEPEIYNPIWKDRWRLDTLPMCPEQFAFQLEPLDDERLRSIELVLKLATSVTNACDAEREGELIFDEIARWFRLYERKVPITRMWIMDTTPRGLQKAWTELRVHDDRKLRILRAQGRTRAEADWIWNLNLTRYASNALGSKKLLKSSHVSVGRVRSPVIAMIADRCRDHVFHVPENYWKSTVVFLNKAGQRCEAELLSPPEYQFGIRDADWSSREAIEERVTHIRLMGVEEWGVIEGEKNGEAKEFPPPPFDLTDLQRTANCLYGWSAKKTLNLAQKLYHPGGHISYPRTDSCKIPTTMAEEVMERRADLWHKWMPKRFGDAVAGFPDWPLVGDHHYSDKIADHYAIIPTGSIPDISDDRGNMSEEYQLWELITLRFIGAWLPPAKVMATSRVFTLPFNAGETLRALVKAAPVIEPEWLLFEEATGKTRRDGRRLEDRLKDELLPEMESTARMAGCVVRRCQTTAPELFTYDTLLHRMEKEGLGTPATRGDQIESSIKIAYIAEDSYGHLVITEEGEIVTMLLRAHGGELIVDPKLTKFWETQLDLVGKPGERGRVRENILADIVRQVRDLGLRMTAPSLVEEVVFCPKTGLLVQDVLDSRQREGWRFGGWPDVFCPKEIARRPMKKSEYRDIFASGRKGSGPYGTGVNGDERFVGKTGNKFAASVVYSKEEARFKFLFKARRG